MRSVWVVVLAFVQVGWLTAQSPAPRQTPGDRVVIGSVADDRQAPIGGARIVVVSDGNRFEPVASDAGGRFEVPVPADTPYALYVTKSGFVGREFRSDELAGALEITLEQAAVVSGRVMDTRGFPVVGIGVRVRRSDPAPGAIGGVQTFVTDSDDRGEFRVGGLTAGRYDIAVQSTPASSSPPSEIAGLFPQREPSFFLAPFGGATGPEMAVDLPRGRETLVELVHDAGDQGQRQITAFVAGFEAGAQAARAGRGADSAGDPARQTGEIVGRVLAVDGQPLSGAMVRLDAIGAGLSRMRSSGEDGGFQFTGLPPGTYRMTASRQGFVQAAYGEDPLSPWGRTIALREGARLARMDVTLPRGSIVTGTVRDALGEPIQGVTVHVWQARYAAGRTVVVPVPGVRARTTDDRGQYRLYGIPPGTYYVVISELDARAYYPGRVALAEALPLQVVAGGDLFGIDTTWSSPRLARVTGVVVDGNGEPYRGGVTLSVSMRSGAPIPEPRLAQAIDGAFEFRHVPPGDYVVQASGRVHVTYATVSTGGGVRINRIQAAGEQASLFGMAYVTVGDLDPAPVTVSLSRGSSIGGTVLVDGGAGTVPAGLMLSAIPADFDQAPINAPPLRTPVGQDGTFQFSDVTGPVRIALAVAPPGWWLESVVVDGVNAADQPVTPDPLAGPRTGVRAVVSTRGATVTGRLEEAARRAAGAYAAVVFSTDATRWYDQSRHVATAQSDQHGSVQVAGLPPGDYWAVAVEGAAPDQLRSPDALVRLTSSARRIRLDAGQLLDVDLRLVRGFQ